MAQFPTYTCRNTYGVYYFRIAIPHNLLDKVQQVLTASGQMAQNSPQSVSHSAAPASSPGAQTTLSGLVDQYCKFKVRKKKWSQKTADENRPILDTLPFVVGDIPLSNVNHNIIEFYAQTLEKLPVSFTKKDKYKNAPDLNTLLVLAQNETSLLNVSMQAKYLNRISTMFKYAIQCQLMTLNPKEI